LKLVIFCYFSKRWTLKQIITMSKAVSANSKGKSTDSRPQWNPSVAVVSRNSQLQSLPGKKRQYENIKSRIRSGIKNGNSDASLDGSTSFRQRNDSSAVAACLYPNGHQSPWPNDANATASGPTDEVPEASISPSRCV
jgi:hypothetical protein